MEIWLDTSDLETVKKAQQMGVLHGVTTNPSVVAKSKLALEDLLHALLEAQKGPVAVQVTASKSDEMVAQGTALSRFSPRLAIKIPVTAEGLKAIHQLSERKIPLIATAVFDANQTLLAARAGAPYIAPYFSPICEEDRDGIEVFRSLIKVPARYGYPSKIIAMSLKNTEQIRECVEMGVAAVTLPEKLFRELIEDHPLTTQALTRYSQDWKKAIPRKSLPL